MMSFLVLIFYIFCTIIRPQEWVRGMIGQPFLDFSVMGVVLFLTIERTISSPRFVKAPQILCMFGFCFAAIMSHLVHFYLGGVSLVINKMFKILVMFFLILQSLNKPRKLKMALWFIVLCIFVLVFQGMDQAATGVGWANQEIFGKEGEEKRIIWIGIFSDPNDLGLAFLFSIGFLSAFVVEKSKLISKLVCFSMICFLLYGVYLTHSRGSMLGTMVMFYFLFGKKTKKWILGGLVGAFFLAVVLAIGSSRLSNITSEEASAHGRVEAWYVGIQMFQGSPLFGKGFKTFNEYHYLTAHNTYVLVLGELGFFGFFFWVAFIYKSYFGLENVQNKDPSLRTYALGIQTGLVGFCCSIFFLSRSYNMFPYLIFALSGSLMFIASQKHSDLKFSITKKDIKYINLVSFALVIVIFVTVKVGI